MIAFLLSPIGKWLVIVLMVAASYAAAYVKGRSDGWEKRDVQAQEETAAQSRETARIIAARSAASERVVVKYRERIRVVKESAEEVIQHVQSLPVVPDLPGPYRVLHDASATGAFPPTSSGVDAAAVSPQDLARTVAENYAGCRANEEQVIGLQNWIRAQSEVK